MNKFSTAILLLSLSGCVGTDVGNPSTESATVEFVVPEVETAAQALSAEGWNIKRLEVQVQSINVETGCDSETYVEVTRQPEQLDLVGANRRISFQAPVPQTCKMEVNFGADNTPWLLAEFVHTTGTRILIEGTAPDRIKYAGNVPLENRLLFSTHPILPWFTEAKTELEALPDGTRLTETENPQLYRSFLRAFLPNARLFVDKDDNGRFEPDDDNVGNAEPPI